MIASTSDMVPQEKIRLRKARDLFHAVAVVTGASGGIGSAIAQALARHSARLHLVDIDATALAAAAAAVRTLSEASEVPLDITSDAQLDSLVHSVEQIGRLDVLVHCAGVIRQGRMENACIADLDLQYATNVRAPYALTKRLLPLLTASRGQVVFVNSSVALNAKRPEIGQYAATKYALRAIADSLREEVNPKGVRVLSVYLGRTATPMQQTLYQENGQEYKADQLLQAEDVASVIVHALTLPDTAEVTDISVRPMVKP